MGTLSLSRRRARVSLPDGLGLQIVVGATIAVGLFGALTQGERLSGLPILPAAVGVLLAGYMATTTRIGVSLGIYCVFIAAVEGPVRLASGNDLVTVGRDVLLGSIALGVVLRAIVQRRTFGRLHLVFLVVGFYVVYCTVQVFNPGNETLSRAVVALRPHLLWVPLLPLGYMALRDTSRLKNFALLLLVLGAANGVVSAIQFTLTPEQLAAWGPGYSSRIYAEGAGRYYVDALNVARVRPFGLGGDYGFGGFIALLAIPCGLSLLLLFRRNRRLMLWVGPLLALNVLAVATSQARSAVLGAVLGVIAFAFISTRSRQLLRTLTALLVAGGLTFLVLSQLVRNSESGLFDRYRTIGVSTVVDSRRAAIEVFPEYVRRFPLGTGLGNVGPGGSFKTEQVTGRNLNGEGQLNYLVIELGIPGLLIMNGLLVYFIYLSGWRIKRLTDDTARVLLAGFGASMIGMVGFWLTGITTAGPPLGPFFFFVGGALVWWLDADKVPLRRRRR